MCADINNVMASSLAHCCPYAVSILHSLYGTYYWKVNRHKRLSVSRKALPMFWNVIWQVKWGGYWEKGSKIASNRKTIQEIIYLD